MNSNKKIYKFTSIISITISVILMLNLILPNITIADSTFGITDIKYDKENAVLTVEGTKLDKHVNSYLYWIMSQDEPPSKDNIEEIAKWCTQNAIKAKLLDSTTINETLKVNKTGKYYAVMLLKEQQQDGSEIYASAIIASYTINTPIIAEDEELKDAEENVGGDINKEQDNGEYIVENNSEEIQQPIEHVSDEEEKQTEEQPHEQLQEQPQKQSEESKIQEKETQQNQDKSGEVDKQTNQIKPEEIQQQIEPQKQPDENITEETDENILPKYEKEDEELYVNINKKDDKKDEYENLQDEDLTEKLIENKENQGPKTGEKQTITNIKDTNNNENQDKSAKIEESKDNKDNVEKLPNQELNIINKSKENIPQAGTNNSATVIAMIVFSVIGLVSFIKYKTIR